ncbi:MAG: hypothetical protein GKR95_21570 [Gammaproteobacteria bacterium]|nr:hypothetical protein [Gammaproteobacteria bacterium]
MNSANYTLSSFFDTPNTIHNYDAYHVLQSGDLKAVSPGIIDLSPLTLISVTGTEAESFLQGQLSNDLTELKPGCCQLHGYCTPKGRALCLIRILRKQNGFWLLLSEDTSTQIIARLKMFKMRAKVEIEIETQQFAFGLIEDTQSHMDLPGDASSFTVEGVIPRKIIVTSGNEQTISQLHSQKTLSFLNHDIWRLIDILSGIPQVYEETMEEFIPQMINLDLVSGVSFKKGCYPGQEIIARLRYLGKLKQRMLIARVNTDQRILPGTALFSPTKPDTKSGIVVDAIRISDEEALVTAIVPTASFEKGELMVESIEGPVITRIPTPYEIPADRKTTQ